jgi:hypothetical protein
MNYWGIREASNLKGEYQIEVGKSIKQTIAEERI